MRSSLHCAGTTCVFVFIQDSTSERPSLLCPTQEAVNMEHSLVEKEVGNLVRATALQIHRRILALAFYLAPPRFVILGPLGVANT